MTDAGDPVTGGPLTGGPTTGAALLGHLNLLELSRESTRWGWSGAIEESDGILLFATGSWLPVVCNGAFRSDDSASPAELIGRADSFFGSRGRGYTVMVHDTPDDEDLRESCRAGGLQVFGEPAPEMIITAPVDQPKLAGVDIGPVTTVEGVVDFATLTGAAYATYGMPVDAPVQLMSRPDRVLAAPHVVAVVAYRGTEPVAGAMALLSHGIAGLYWVGTVETARRSGLGRAVTAAVTNISFAAGASAVTLQASVMGEPVYRSMGFRSIYHYEDWVRLKAPRAPAPERRP